MNILEIYKKYEIMPQLQEHQLRVAGVAKVICNNLSPTLPTLGEGEVVAACLLHDMGNIVKFDFEYSKRFLYELSDLKNLEHWKKNQAEYRQKYGKDSHKATMGIVNELKVSQRVKELVDCIGFDKGEENVNTKDFAKKICAYSDMRVEPEGVALLEERFKGLRHRYQNHYEGQNHDREVFENSLRKIEKQIFSQCKIRPEEVTDESVSSKLEILRNYEI